MEKLPGNNKCQMGFIYLFVCFPKRILFKICLRIFFVIESWSVTNKTKFFSEARLDLTYI